MSIEDKAQEHEAEEWARINAPRPGPSKYAPDEAGYGPPECVECEDEMPAVRRSYGYVVCVSCKEAAERLQRR